MTPVSAVLWVCQTVLALVSLGAGGIKLARSRERILANPNLQWAEDYSAAMIRAIGVAEVLFALGLVLPEATGLAEWLTPSAALGVAAIQVGAGMAHRRRGENHFLPVNAALLLLAAVVAVGRG